MTAAYNPGRYWSKMISNQEGVRTMAGTIINGTVARINGKGFIIAEQEGWLNISKYAKNGEAPMPTVGERVRLWLDTSGFVRRIESMPKAEPEPQQETTPAPAVPVGNVDGKDLRITRLACLNTATAILSSGGRPTCADKVLDLAARLEAWALR